MLLMINLFSALLNTALYVVTDSDVSLFFSGLSIGVFTMLVSAKLGGVI